MDTDHAKLNDLHTLPCLSESESRGRSFRSVVVVVVGACVGSVTGLVVFLGKYGFIGVIIV